MPLEGNSEQPLRYSPRLAKVPGGRFREDVSVWVSEGRS